jgi:hypothetical protein
VIRARHAAALAAVVVLCCTWSGVPTFVHIIATRFVMSDAAAAPADPQPLDPGVVEKLTEYDQTREPVLLKEAADAAALHDRQMPPDPSLGLALGRARVASWLAILSRFKRDADPGFDPAKVPSLHVAPPPTASGAQLPPGVRPSDVKDPEARKVYIEEIEKNRVRLANFGRDSELFRARAVVLERAVGSIADARTTLGMPAAEIGAMMGGAAIDARDLEALQGALR